MTGSTAGAAGRRDALLIATGSYDHKSFKALRSPAQDCARLAGVLADRSIGGFRTEQLKDARAHEVMRTIEEFFRDRSRGDLLLLHISCHGIKDDEDGSLYFAARDTDSELLASTAVPASFLRERMDRCRASIVLLLDCCYSGAFLPGMKGDDRVHVKDELGGHGRAVLTATSRTEYAWEGKHLKTGVPAPSRFTGALIEGLSTGAADRDGDGRITVTELYDYVYESLHRAGVKQRPRMWADLEYQVTIARTAGAGSPPGEGPSRQGTRTFAEGADFSDIMDAFFDRSAPEAEQGQRPGSGDRGEAEQPMPRSRVRRGQDALIRVELDLLETAQGMVKDIAVDTATVCPACDGAGTAEGTSPQQCPSCHGRGETPEGKRGFLGQAKASRTCRTCQGYGTVIPHQCPECAGDGRVRSRRNLRVQIPAGVDNGTRIRLDGEGEVGPGGGPAGDLFIEIVERPHDHFRREGDDLHGWLFLSRAQASKGGTFQVDTLLDGPKSIRVPAGTPDGRIFRLRKLGVTHLRGGGRGDLLIRVRT